MAQPVAEADAVDALDQTIVMVTHDPVAASHADTVLFLADGRIVDAMAAPSADRVLFLADGEIVRDLDTCDAHTVIATMEERRAS